MAAAKTVHQFPVISCAPPHGIITLFGYRISVRVDRGHLLLEGGIGPERHYYRLPRVGHRLRRLIIIGADGYVSLAALEWLRDQRAAFVMLERDGKLLCTTGPVYPSDARLRRAQGTAHYSGVAVRIARELINRKLAGQEEIARNKLHDTSTAQQIADYRLGLAEAETIDQVRSLEAFSAAAYWVGWRYIQITFPNKDLPRVPEHWRIFNTRKSPLSGSPRVAANPLNAVLNYVYTLLESEARLAVATLGLDVGLGFVHADAPWRDSLAHDVMEPVRPEVDRFVLNWFTTQPLNREWFFERRDGSCRLMSCLTARLSETAPMWARAVAPHAEWVVRQLWSANRKKIGSDTPPTPLTQRHRRTAQGGPALPPQARAPRLQNFCRGCGKAISDESSRCAQCAISAATERLEVAAEAGRKLSHTPEARAKQAKHQRSHKLAQRSWNPSSKPAWLSEQVYAERIQPRLATMSNSAIAKQIGVSRQYASQMRKGYRPHPRHWEELSRLVRVSEGN